MLAVMAATTDDPLLVALRGPRRDAAIGELHALLLRAARFELSRRDVAPGEREDLATEAADDALMAVLGEARHVPRRQPLHDLGVQVRAARGGREGAPARVARP